MKSNLRNCSSFASQSGNLSAAGCVEIDDVSNYPGPLRESISRLSDQDLGLMTREDLLHMIRLSHVMLHDQLHGGLEWAGEADLRTMARAVRTCCRNHLGAFHHRRGNIYAWE